MMFGSHSSLHIVLHMWPLPSGTRSSLHIVLHTLPSLSLLHSGLHTVCATHVIISITSFVSLFIPKVHSGIFHFFSLFFLSINFNFSSFLIYNNTFNLYNIHTIHSSPKIILWKNYVFAPKVSQNYDFAPRLGN